MEFWINLIAFRSCGLDRIYLCFRNTALADMGRVDSKGAGTEAERLVGGWLQTFSKR